MHNYTETFFRTEILPQSLDSAHTDESTHPVGELGSTVVPLGQIENRVMIGMMRVQERTDILHMVPVAQLHRLRRI